MSLLRRWVIPLCGLALLAGCYQDKTSATGDMGRIVYSLYTDYDVPESDLRQARIITGHTQRLDLDLTDRGERDIPHPDLLRHRLTPSQGASVTTEVGSGSPPSVWVDVTVQEPGAYTLESLLDDRVMDRVDLQFERLDGFQMIVKVRAPWTGHFDRVSGDPITVGEGSQMVLEPVPVDASGDRLAGDMSTLVSVEPRWAVTPGRDVLFDTEHSMWSFRGAIDFYFIEPGPVTFTVSDPVVDASSQQRFDVTPVQQ